MSFNTTDQVMSDVTTAAFDDVTSEMTEINAASSINASGNSTSNASGGGDQDIFTIVLYVLIGSVGILGNSMVCAVFGLLRSRRSQVNLFIFHQAFVDLLTSFLLISFGLTQIYRQEINDASTTTRTVTRTNSSVVNNSYINYTYKEEITEPNIPFALAEFMCRFWWARVFLFSNFAISTYNLTAMAVERYMAIMHPFLYATKFQRKHALTVILLLWLVAPIMQYFPAIFQYHAIADTLECGIQDSWTPNAQAALGVSLFVWEFIIPCAIMGFSSVKVFRNLQRRDLYLNKTTNALMHENETPPTPEKKSNTIKTNRNTTMVVIIIFVVYVICWTPNQITFLGFNLGMYLDFTGKWYHTTVILAFVNSCINPFIYAIRLNTFQRGVVHICRVGCTPIQSSTTNSLTMAQYNDVRNRASMI